MDNETVFENEMEMKTPSNPAYAEELPDAPV